RQPGRRRAFRAGVDQHRVDRARLELRPDCREIDLNVGELDPECGKPALDMRAHVERQRTSEHALASEIAPLLDLVLVAGVNREAYFNRVRPERLHRLAFDFVLEALEAV